LTRHGFDQALRLVLEIITFTIEQMKQGVYGIKIRAQPCIEMTYIFTLDFRI
jgi:hypothetical protein